MTLLLNGNLTINFCETISILTMMPGVILCPVAPIEQQPSSGVFYGLD